jgi:purine-nucleoside phosphorylase
VTSAGQIVPVREPPYLIIIDRALRDEGTSYHYLAPSDYSPADERLVGLAGRSLAAGGMPVQMGAAWTTDAPFRETADAIGAAHAAGILAVEMEAAALYAFAAARERAVLCIAHITNQMGRVDGDFEKGAADGAAESLRLITLVGQAWCEQGSRMPTSGSEA